MAKTRFGSLDGIHQIKKKNAAETTIISAVLFILIFVVFLFAVSKASEGSKHEQRQSLTDAIDRAIIQCYVTEGRYPESFDYLQKNYGIIYDDEEFRVDYVIYGSNMRPEVTIISLK
ncbi:MAG: hypothetical protein II833_07245 [Pseudobutyrivibrio sp.]|uniref:Uncharacterized protein n=1 Tax=Pseudobutyrivibrio ruminis TaxID=46206 RepID=A0A927U559_9FIRM|nr:hypothetical protein [Pseudobutyrivibrio sp.]MBE5918476.1 hypothetical protein [Pseudobutyrivibrio ruminis]MBQ3774168.1 hypothetical protein [Pseudobutyrivibrio sp.]MBQ6462325.1 hypothetical protein [Pseudobutyrivibrio sp.]